MPSFVPASARTMALFELFAREKRELSNSDVARYMDLPESSCSDLLHTLYQAGYLMRTARSRRFYPTGRLVHLGKDISDHDPRFEAGQEAVEILAEKTEETAFCGILDDGAVKVISVSEGRHPLRYVLKVGERVGLNVSAMGKAILGSLDLEDARALLAKKPLRQVTKNSLVTAETLLANVKKQARRGWYSAVDEGTDGVTAYSLSGFIGGELVAFSICGPTDRITQNEKTHLDALRDVAGMTFSAAQP